MSNSDVNFTFDLITRSPSLKPRFYNTYQTFLYNTISGLLDKGMNYKQIADWLNDNGYKTLRGSKFRNAHTHSIIQKKRMSDSRYSKTYPSQLNNCSIEVIDKTLINQ